MDPSLFATPEGHHMAKELGGFADEGEIEDMYWESFAEGYWGGEQGIGVALTGGLFYKESSILGEDYLGLVDTSDPAVDQGVWGGRAYTGTKEP